jgi:hypothetical protein
VHHETIEDLNLLATRWITDFYYYDCADRTSGNHKAEQIRNFILALSQKPSNDLQIILFRHIETLTEVSAHALLHIFEDVPNRTLILTTSVSPTKILPTLLSRMVILDNEKVLQLNNPLQNQVDDFIDWNPESLFRMTLAPSKESKFTQGEALWVIQGLQDAISCGRISTQHAKTLRNTRIQLENTNTIPKYLIDQLLIHISCD